ncbi:MAG: alpha-2-macroglobulin family protein, partial [Planctomycetota bacterium]
MRLLLLFLCAVAMVAGESDPLAEYTKIASELREADRNGLFNGRVLGDPVVTAFTKRIAALEPRLGEDATNVLTGLCEQALGPEVWIAGRIGSVMVVDTPMPLTAVGGDDAWSLARVPDGEPIGALWERIFEAPYHPALAGTPHPIHDRLTLGAPGLYLLTCRADDRRAARWVARDDLRVRTLDDGHRVLLTVTDRSGTPVAGAEVLVLAELRSAVGQPARVFTASTGSDGIADLLVDPPGQTVTLRWVVRSGPRVAAGTAEVYAEQPTARWGRRSRNNDSGTDNATFVHVSSAQPVHRPGDTAHLAVIVRRWQQGVLQANAGTPLRLTLFLGGEQLGKPIDVTSDAFGRAATDVVIPTTAALGPVSLSWSTGDHGAQGSQGVFTIEEARIPDAELELSAEHTALAPGEDARLTVRARSLSGEPLGGLAGWIEIVSTGLRLPMMTGLDGTAVVVVGADLLGSRSEIRAVVADPGGRELRSTIRLRGDGEFDHLVITTPDAWTSPEEGVLVLLACRDRDDVAHAARVTLSARLEVDGRNNGMLHVESVEIGRDGTAAVRLRLPQCGSWRLSASNAVGERDITGADGRCLVTNGSDGALHLRRDREVYRVGDEALVRIVGPPTWALAVIDAGGINERHLIDLRNGPGELRLPIIPAYAAGVRVLVSMSTTDGKALSAGIRLPIAAPEPGLVVTIEAPARVAPGSEIDVVVRVRDALGRPVPGSLALGVVDEGLYRIAEDRAPRLNDFFIPVPRAEHVRAREPYLLRADKDSLDGWFDVVKAGTCRLAGRQWTPSDGSGGAFMAIGAGGASTGMFGSRSGGGSRRAFGAAGGSRGGLDSPSHVRQNLRECAFWSPDTLTNDNGVATVRMRLPENLGGWRATARVATRDHRAGEARVVFQAAKPLMVRVVAPRVLRPGESTSLRALVSNVDASERTVTITWELSGVMADAPLTSELYVAAGATLAAELPVHVGNDAKAKLTVRAVSGDIGDGVEVEVPVESFGFPRAWSAGGAVAAGKSIALPASGDGALLTVRLTRGPAGVAADAAAFLRGFPYGCAEQTLSRALPASILAPLLTPEQRAAPAFADLPEILDVSLRRLARTQNDGAWGWWPGGPSEAWITAWTWTGVRALGDAELSGPTSLMASRTKVAERLTAALADPVLRRMWTRTPSSDVDDDDARADAAVTYSNGIGSRLDAHAGLLLAAALAGNGLDAAALKPLIADAPKLAAVERALFALALQRAGDRDNAAHVWQQALAGGGPDAGIEPALEAAWWVRAAAVFDPQGARAGEAMQRLLSLRRGGTWGTTWTTAAALLAIADHLRAHPAAVSPPATWTMTLDGKQVDVKIATSQGDGMSITIPVPAQGGALMIAGAGWWDASLAWRSAEPAPPMSAGITLTRQVWHLAQGDLGEEQRTLVNDGDTIPAGSLLLVELTLDTRQAADHILVEDPKASGIEPLLGESGVRHGAADNRELRREHTAFFLSRIPVGRTMLAYRARVELSGAPCWPPAIATAMYVPRIQSTTAALHLRVGPAAPVVASGEQRFDRAWISQRSAAVVER